MQTFLPVADFDESARLLDSPRLGKQRVETLQVLRALELPDYGWVSHPVVRMWRGRTGALVVYGRAMVREWRARGFADSTDTLIAEFAPELASSSQAELAAAGLLPSWVGDEELHRSHRSNLVAKDAGFYRPAFAERFPGEPDDLPYKWPEPDDVPPPPAPDGVLVWVVKLNVRLQREGEARNSAPLPGEEAGAVQEDRLLQVSRAHVVEQPHHHWAWTRLPNHAL